MSLATKRTQLNLFIMTNKTAQIRNGDDLRAARVALDLTTYDFGLALGYEGSRKTVQQAINALENDRRDLPRHVVLLVECFLQGARPHSWPTPND